MKYRVNRSRDHLWSVESQITNQLLDNLYCEMCHSVKNEVFAEINRHAVGLWEVNEGEIYGVIRGELMRIIIK